MLVYGHYDVQPTGDPAEWLTQPFELTTDGDVVRGRGASDDKGPVYVVLKTVQTFLARQGPAAGEREVPVRGRGGNRQPAPGAVPDRAPRGAGRRSGDLRGRCDVAAGRAVAVAGLQGAGQPSPTSSSRAPRPTCTPAGTAARWPTRCTRSPPSSRACTGPTAASRCRASMPGYPRSPPPAGRRSPPFPSMSSATQPSWG